MMDSITKVDMDDISEALPAFITMIMMVLTYSIADGMVVGCCAMYWSSQDVANIKR